MDKIIINNLLSLYNNYCYRSDIVFTHIDDNLVILRKLPSTIDNESRHDINNIVTATYIGCNFVVENIINIWNPYITSFLVVQKLTKNKKYQDVNNLIICLNVFDLYNLKQFFYKKDYSTLYIG